MDLSTCYCRDRYCRRYGRSGSGARLESMGWHTCTCVPVQVSWRAPFAMSGVWSPVFQSGGHGLRGDSDAGRREAYRKGVCHLAEGVSIRATARLMECDKDTVCHWLPRVGRHCRHVLEYFFRDLHLTREACQLDELWTSCTRRRSI